MAKFTKSPTLERQLGAAIDRGLAAAVIVLGRAITEKLSHPGGGRVYAKKSNAKKAIRGNSPAAMRLIKRYGVSYQQTRSGRVYITQSSANRIFASENAKRVAKGRKVRTLRELGFHRASAPGEPPAPDTGNLRRSWQVGASSPKKITYGRKRVYRVGSAVPYARKLEFGGNNKDGSYVAPRPYAIPSMNESEPAMMAAFKAAVAGTLAASANFGTEIR